MKRISIGKLFALSGLLAFCLSGCFVKTVDELYLLPKHSDAYYNLEAALDPVLAQNAQYSAPVSGNNQQSVQLADLDGDGEEEAIAFLKTSREKPLSAYIFDLQDEQFRNVAVLEGSGSAFESVEYVQLDGEPGLEIVIGRQLSDEVLHAMSTYAYRDGHMVELMSANYTEYTLADLNDDGLRDLMLLRFDAEQHQAVAELYCWEDDQLQRQPEASLSLGVESIKRVVTGFLANRMPAVFVAGVYEGSSIVTDVFAFRGGTFQNITSTDSGTSAGTVRSYFVYATDIDGDGLMELPEIVQLPGGESGEPESVIRWYSLDINGKKTYHRNTYHRFSAGWYVTLNDSWGTDLVISRSEEVSGVRGLVFSEYRGENQSAVPIFTIYAFSGEERTKLAQADGRFLLAEKGDVSYAAEIGSSLWAQTLTEGQLKAMFRFIQVDWNSGET